MPNIKLKGQNGENLTFNDVERVYFDSADEDGEVVYYTHGQAVSKTVEPNFASGDMPVPIAKGELVTELTIIKPADLLPENIRAGKTIGGVEGKLDKYIEYTLNENGEVTAAKMFGFTEIPAGCFAYMSALASVDLSGSPGITSVGARAFQGCSSLTNIEIPNTVKSLGAYAFYQCTALANVNIPDGVTSIGNHTFYSCDALASITIPDSVTSIGENAFYSCDALANVNIPDGVTSIGSYTFGFCKALASITIPDSVTSIGAQAFVSTALTSITIPEGVTSIGAQAFGSCANLTSATFKDKTTWYVGTSAGATTTQVDVTSASTAATYLKDTHKTKYWTKV